MALAAEESAACGLQLEALQALSGMTRLWRAAAAHGLLDADIPALARIVEHNLGVTVREPALVPRSFQQAFHLMRSGRPGPVLIDLPFDVQKDFQPVAMIAKLPNVMIVNKDLVYSFRFDVRLRLPGASIVRVSPYTGAEEPLDGEQPWLAPGGGVLLRVSWPP